MVLVALAFLGGAFWTGKNTYELVTQGTHVQGKITGVKEEWSNSTRTRNGYTEKNEQENIPLHRRLQRCGRQDRAVQGFARRRLPAL